MCSIYVIENQISFFFIDVVRERVLSPCGEIVGAARAVFACGRLRIAMQRRDPDVSVLV